MSINSYFSSRLSCLTFDEFDANWFRIPFKFQNVICHSLKQHLMCLSFTILNNGYANRLRISVTKLPNEFQQINLSDVNALPRAPICLIKKCHSLYYFYIAKDCQSYQNSESYDWFMYISRDSTLLCTTVVSLLFTTWINSTELFQFHDFCFEVGKNPSLYIDTFELLFFPKL